MGQVREAVKATLDVLGLRGIARTIRDGLKERARFRHIHHQLSAFHHAGSYGYEDIERLHRIFGDRTPQDYSSEAREARARVLLDRFHAITDVQGKSFLDVGTGHGSDVVEFALAGARLAVGVAIEVNPIAHEEARRCKTKTFFFPADAANAPFRNGCFDLVHTNAIEHFARPYESFDELVRITSPGGLLVLFIGGFYHTPDAAHLHNLINIPWSHLLFDHDLLIRYVREHAATQEEAEHTVQQFTELNRLDADHYKEMIFGHKDCTVKHYREHQVGRFHRNMHRLFRDRLSGFTDRALFVHAIDAVLAKR